MVRSRAEIQWHYAGGCTLEGWGPGGEICTAAISSSGKHFFSLWIFCYCACIPSTVALGLGDKGAGAKDGDGRVVTGGVEVIERRGEG
jgi:hypothetical protein